MRAWSFYTVNGDPTYAGHEGYDDVLGEHYSYDSDVPNHKRVGVGDLIVLRDQDGSLGIASIVQIITGQGSKVHRRCPTCQTSQIDERKTLSPRYRCTNGHTFTRAAKTTDVVESFRAEFGPTYVAFEAISRAELNALCVARSQQNAIRELHVDQLLRKLRAHGLNLVFTAH